MNDIDVNVTAWKIGPVIIMRGTATPTHKVAHPECFGRFTVIPSSPCHRPRRSANACAASPGCAPTARHANNSTNRKEQGHESHHWHQTDHRGLAHQRRQPRRDRAIPAHPHRRGQGHHPASRFPHHHSPNAPNSSNHTCPHWKNPPTSGTIGRKVKESTQTVETTPFPTPSKHRGRRSGK